MKNLFFVLALALGFAAEAQEYAPPSIDIVYVLSIKDGIDTIYNAAERPRVEWVKEKKNLWGKIKDKGSDLAGKASDAAENVGWKHPKGMTVEAPDPSKTIKLEPGPIVTRSFRVDEPKSSCVADLADEYCLVVKSNHSYENPMELVQILPVKVNGRKREYEFLDEFVTGERPYLYCKQVEPYGADAYLCHLDLPAGEYAVTVADQPTLVHFFSIIR